MPSGPVQNAGGGIAGGAGGTGWGDPQTPEDVHHWSDGQHVRPHGWSGSVQRGARGRMGLAVRGLLAFRSVLMRGRCVLGSSGLANDMVRRDIKARSRSIL